MPPVQTRLPTSSPSAAHARAATSPLSTSSPITASRSSVPAPYMVALSGWPEPVYIANVSRPSRPSSPRQPQPQNFGGEVSDGIGNSSSPASSPIQPQPPKSTVKQRHEAAKEHGGHDESSRNRTSHTASTSRHFPTSSTRTPTHSPPPMSPPAAVYNRHSTFKDPRLAVKQYRPLTIAPNWTSSTSNSAQSPVPNVGVKVPAGERGTGILVMRSTPDVYPPPVPPGIAGMATSMARVQPVPNGRVGVGLATEVYPRDPDSAFLWGGTTTAQSAEGPFADEEMGSERSKDW